MASAIWLFERSRVFKLTLREGIDSEVSFDVEDFHVMDVVQQFPRDVLQSVLGEKTGASAAEDPYQR